MGSRQNHKALQTEGTLHRWHTEKAQFKRGSVFHLSYEKILKATHDMDTNTTNNGERRIYTQKTSIIFITYFNILQYKALTYILATLLRLLTLHSNTWLELLIFRTLVRMRCTLLSVTYQHFFSGVFHKTATKLIPKKKAFLFKTKKKNYLKKITFLPGKQTHCNSTQHFIKKLNNHNIMNWNVCFGAKISHCSGPQGSLQIHLL